MTKRYLSRRLILVGCTATVAALACGDDADGETDDGAGGTSGPGGATSTGGASAGGASAGGANVGGDGTGGAVVCGAMLLVKGSNYASDPHDLTIPVTDFEASAEKTYKTTGNGHTHDITLTVSDFAALRAGETVKKYVCYTNANNTDHEFVISCADPNIMPTFEGEIGTPGSCPA